MAITKYDLYYNKITNQLDSIRKEHDYPNLSVAFAHWYLSNYQNQNEQQIAESIIDGKDDMGIDAIIVENIDGESYSLTIVQFKYPSNSHTIAREIDQSEILKTWNGFTTLVKNDITYEGDNIKFADYKKLMEEMPIIRFRIVFASFNKGIIANKSTIESLVNTFKIESGSEVDIIYHNRDAIANIYEKLNRKNSLQIKLKYKQMASSYNVESRSINSYSGFVNASDLVSSIKPYMSTIFDENIRLYEYNSKVNEGIRRTATSSIQAEMFFFYNNGIVFICNKAANSPASNEIILTGASVVNGCQTLNVLYNASESESLEDNVYLSVRIIEIADYTERMRITEFLNSQTQIKASYFVANHPVILELKSELFKKGYYLERQINEYRYMKEMGNSLPSMTVIQLESSIQYFVGYWNNKNASLAKREKAGIFDKNRLDSFLATIDADKVIEAHTTYKRISEILTLYRKMRRNDKNKEFSSFIDVSQEWLISEIDSFRFMNTADILLLNCIANIRNKICDMQNSHRLPAGFKLSLDECVFESIYLIRYLVSKESETNMSALTKKAPFFEKMQQCVLNL